jgi:geranylgeranyl diphosphate synthase type I
MSPEDHAFGELVTRVRADVEERLAREVAQAVHRAELLSPRARDVVAALGALALRGGKRVRAVLVAAAYEACGGEGGASRVTAAGASIEILHAYLLVHDDWMDQDEVRRGGPSVHVLLRGRLRDDRLGDAAAILAGDFGCAVAQRLLLEVDVPPARLAEAARVLARIQEDVVLGQTLDLLDTSCDVETKHDLKTGSYTVRGPLALGAALAGASTEQRAALERFGGPLGIAFQLRDDLLGLFGEAREVGKPIGSDLRQGKRTALVAEAGASLEGTEFSEAARLALRGAIRAIGRREK